MKFIKYIFDTIYCPICRCVCVMEEHPIHKFVIFCPNPHGCENYNIKCKIPVEIVEVELEKI